MQSQSATREFSELFGNLADVRSNEQLPRTSIYLPLSRDEFSQTIVARISKQIDEARRLLSKAMDLDGVDRYLAPLEQRLPYIAPQAESRGIAIFLAEKGLRVCSLPVSPPELVVVSESFHIKPLLHARSLDDHCYVIQIRRRVVNVFSWATSSLSLERRFHVDTLLSAADERESLHLSELNAAGRAGFLKCVAERIRREFDLVGSAFAILGTKSKRRRLLAYLGAEPENLIYSAPAQGQIEQHLPSIHDALVRRFEKSGNAMAQEMMSLMQIRVATNSLLELAEAALDGQIDTLFVDPNVQIWGQFNREIGSVETYEGQRGPHDDCVIDDIAEEVLRRRGVIRFFDSRALPGSVPFLGVLRNKCA